MGLGRGVEGPVPPPINKKFLSLPSNSLEVYLALPTLKSGEVPLSWAYSMDTAFKVAQNNTWIWSGKIKHFGFHQLTCRDHWPHRWWRCLSRAGRRCCRLQHPGGALVRWMGFNTLFEKVEPLSGQRSWTFSTGRRPYFPSDSDTQVTSEINQ